MADFLLDALIGPTGVPRGAAAGRLIDQPEYQGVVGRLRRVGVPDDTIEATLQEQQAVTTGATAMGGAVPPTSAPPMMRPPPTRLPGPGTMPAAGGSSLGQMFTSALESMMPAKAPPGPPGGQFGGPPSPVPPGNFFPMEAPTPLAPTPGAGTVDIFGGLFDPQTANAAGGQPVGPPGGQFGPMPFAGGGGGGPPAAPPGTTSLVPTPPPPRMRPQGGMPQPPPGAPPARVPGPPGGQFGPPPAPPTAAMAAPAPAAGEEPGWWDQLLQNPDLMEIGLRMLQASQPTPGSPVGPTFGAVAGQAGLGQIQSNRTRAAAASEREFEERKLKIEQERARKDAEFEEKKLKTTDATDRAKIESDKATNDLRLQIRETQVNIQNALSQQANDLRLMGLKQDSAEAQRKLALDFVRLREDAREQVDDFIKDSALEVLDPEKAETLRRDADTRINKAAKDAGVDIGAIEKADEEAKMREKRVGGTLYRQRPD